MSSGDSIYRPIYFVDTVKGLVYPAIEAPEQGAAKWPTALTASSSLDDDPPVISATGESTVIALGNGLFYIDGTLYAPGRSVVKIGEIAR